MKSEVINNYFNDFNKFVYEVDGLEFWFARDLQNLLGYSKWENFLNIIEKAKIACENSDIKVDDHFAYTVRAVDMPNGGVKEAEDMFLTRYACYLVAQNGDSSKEQVAFAMSYFAIQTRKQELLEKRIGELERLQIREKLSYSEKILSGMIYEKGIDSQGFAIIKSKGDQALFGGYNTSDMKKRLGIPNSRPLADFLPTITIKAKDFANEITIFNLKKDGTAKSMTGVSLDHEQNNRDVRKLLLQKGIIPENLPAEEDVKKLQRKLKSDDKLIVKTAKKLKTKK
jgi:DNA-damage-inducible protein D